MYLNFETTVLFHDINFNRKVAVMLEKDFQHCRALRRSQKPILRAIAGLRDNAARLLAPIL